MKTILQILIIGLMFLGLTSCNKFLDVKPEDRFLSEDVFKQEVTIYQSLNGIYLNLSKPNLYGESLTMGTVDVMAQYYNPVNRWSRLSDYDYSDNGVQNVYASLWRNSYVAILNANSFLDKLGRSNNVVSNDKKDILMGEAYALRAFVHFDILRLFGPVYATSPDKMSIPYLTISTEKIQPLLPAKTVLDSVLADLKRAELLLTNDPIRREGVVAVSGNDLLGDFYKLRNRRLNYFAVLGLKARVLLYKGDKKAAFTEAVQVINQANKWFPWTAGAQTLPGILNPDRNFSSEIIFGLQNYDMYNSQKALFAPMLDVESILAPVSERLEEFFEYNENDYRMRINWVSGDAYAKTYKTFMKYEDVVSKGLLFRNFQPLLRMSEMYYIAAECADTKDIAIEYINQVRTHRGLIDLDASEEINDAIRNEYRKEFWGEGQMFFYYKRKNFSAIPSGIKSGEVSMTPEKYVVPLPLSETQNR